MAKQYTRARRGMVFWLNPAKVYNQDNQFLACNGKKYPTHLQMENRPWMVVSNNEGNDTSPTCNIVPITLEDKPVLPCHVKFIYEGRQQTVLCEQVRTVDTMALKDFIYIVSDEVLQKVERAIAIQFAIRPSISTADFTLDTTLKHLEKIIAQIIQEKVEIYKQEIQPQVIPVSQVENTALHLGQMLEDLCSEAFKKPEPEEVVPEEPAKPVEQPVVSEPKPIKETKPSSIQRPTKNDRPLSQIEKFNLKLQKSRQLNGKAVQNAVVNSIGKSDVALDKSQPEKKPDESGKKPTEKKKRNNWTVESRQAYLEDCEKLSPAEVMKKWNLGSIQSVFQTKYACKNALNK